jgi:hypothetical protein
MLINSEIRILKPAVESCQAKRVGSDLLENLWLGREQWPILATPLMAPSRPFHHRGTNPLFQSSSRLFLHAVAFCPIKHLSVSQASGWEGTLERWLYWDAVPAGGVFWIGPGQEPIAPLAADDDTAYVLPTPDANGPQNSPIREEGICDARH